MAFPGWKFRLSYTNNCVISEKLKPCELVICIFMVFLKKSIQPRLVDAPMSQKQSL